MTSMDRRQFLGGTALLGLTGLLAACSGGTAARGGGDGGATLTWWDHFGGLQNLHKEWSAKQGKAFGVTIEYTYNEPGNATEALQLANQGNNLPDIFSPQVLGLPLPALVDAGWAHELPLSDATIARLPEGTFVEGMTMLDGKYYGLPAFTAGQWVGNAWFNKKIAEEVGFTAPKSYDQLLAALKAVADHGKYAPMTMALGNPGRIREQLDDLAQAGGFPGYQGLRYDTAEYEYHHDSYVNAIELYKEMSDKGWLMPGTNGFQIPDARGRWAAGTVAFQMDGPYSPGAVRSLNPGALEFMDIAGMPTPDGEDIVATRGARGSDWLVSGRSEHVEIATKVIETLLDDEYQKGLAAGMDAPPIMLDVVETADVIEPYRRLVGEFKTHVFRAPMPQVRNVDVLKAQALMVPVQPDLGAIVQGYIGGDVTDLKAELTKLSDSFSSALDTAISGATAAGAKVSRSDWEFADWKRGVDYPG